jgi:hypothetical protein
MQIGLTLKILILTEEFINNFVLRHLKAIHDLPPGYLIFNESPTAFTPGASIVCLRRT